MWIGRLPLPQSPPVHLEIVIYFNLNVELGVVKIQNYNKSVRDGTKGVRDIELYLNDELKYDGIVKMGRGQLNEDFSQIIQMQPTSSIHVIEEVPDARNEETIDYSSNSIG